MKKLLFFVIFFSSISHIFEATKVNKYDCHIYHTLEVCQKSKYCLWDCQNNICVSAKKYVGKGKYSSIEIKCPKKSSTSVTSHTSATTSTTTTSSTTSTTSTTDTSSSTYTGTTTKTQTTTSITASNTITLNRLSSTSTNINKTTTPIVTETLISITDNSTHKTYPQIIIYNASVNKSHKTRSQLGIILPIILLTSIIIVLLYKLYYQKKEKKITDNQYPINEREEPILQNNNYGHNPNNNLINEPEYLEPHSLNNNFRIQESNLSVPIYSEINDPEYSYSLENNSNYDVVI